MTRKEQNKILDNKIESNINQYKVDRLNTEISAFSSGDLNKYQFLTRKNLNYKPNTLDKARVQFSPLGQTFSIGLDKTAQGYQEEGVIKLLKDIRDSLARPPRPNNNRDEMEMIMEMIMMIMMIIIMIIDHIIIDQMIMTIDHIIIDQVIIMIVFF